MSSQGSSPLSQEKVIISENSRRRAIADVISKTYPSFDHRATVVEPFDSESRRDVEFLEKLNVMLLELMLEFHAWSTARPAHESDTTADALEKEVKTVIELEKEQEKTRQRLNEFVTRIKLALAALTGLSG
ncbi:uncharacterized protein C8Q71DRAFT_412560 [Rhodofomes roseus]|uniref:Uncharacterized protein n=1 Tax=Rhodofomes roseus TaxID=34475 RepID=A0ABQ8KR04_9APHY|nr:uncharacterized protein C8Q71DRAFT_412560 [Rhodofomes roseus]KAH9840550.1 hypothetical protein C8Q71DRAFT_412560 [Rhodofomes roseus]